MFRFMNNPLMKKMFNNSHGSNTFWSTTKCPIVLFQSMGWREAKGKMNRSPGYGLPNPGALKVLTIYGITRVAGTLILPLGFIVAAFTVMFLPIGIWSGSRYKSVVSSGLFPSRVYLISALGTIVLRLIIAFPSSILTLALSRPVGSGIR